jgi:hypothetical protein
MVSDTGAVFMTSADGKLWTLANPESVRGYEGRIVSLRAEPSGKELRVHSVRGAQPQVKHVNWSDAALRR